MLTAEIEYITSAVAHCPYCEEETHPVDGSSSGEIECDNCGADFRWSTEG